MLYAD